jgi:hypothetical protein
VGTTTIRLGVTRHGPSAPEASQLGKYDAFTNTGVPVRLTSNEMRSPSSSIPVTWAGGTGRAGTVPSVERTRRQASGPPAARWTSGRPASMNQGADSSSHAFSPPAMAGATTGSLASGSTSWAPATS